jgi:hypothetical protein
MLRGWDFEELADEWGLYLPDYLDDYSDVTTSDWIKMYLENFVFKVENTRVRRKAASDIREYCRLMSEDDCCYQCPIWEGYAKLEDDFTTIQMFIPIIEHAWT